MLYAVPLILADHEELCYRNNKFVVGTQLGILSIFNRSKGWGDCVDRIPGYYASILNIFIASSLYECRHPSSIDALCALTPDVVLTGSSDGFIRAVQILPTKFLGIIADHGEFPIERLKLDRQAKWLGSASHDEILKLTDVGDALEESDEDEDEDGKAEGERSMTVDMDGKEDGGEAGLGDMSALAKQESKAMPDEDSDATDSDGGKTRTKKKRRKKSKNAMGSRKKAGGIDKSFFSGL